MKSGRIARRDQVIMLHPNVRIGMLEDMKELEVRILKIKKILQTQTEDLLMVHEDLRTLHSRIRELGAGRTTDEGRKTE